METGIRRINVMNIQQMKVTGDITSMGVVVTTLMGYLPAIAALLTIIWTIIRIWETDTVKGWVRYLKFRRTSSNQPRD